MKLRSDASCYEMVFKCMMLLRCIQIHGFQATVKVIKGMKKVK